MNNRESLILAVGMSGKGAMEIILGQLAHQAGLISDALFVALVIMALTTSLFVGPVIQRLMRAKQQRRLSAMLNDRTLILQLHATDAREAIRELSDRAGQITGVDPLEIDRAVWDREQMMRTGVGDGIAVPHARLAELSKPLIVLGRSEPGIDFDAPDQQPARLIFLILTPVEDQTAQIELLSVIAKTFRLESTRELMLKAANLAEALAAVNMAEHTPGH
jgi:mannitol/fructose-specific phosphotransferase system IIA component (Ntr-type)